VDTEKRECHITVQVELYYTNIHPETKKKSGRAKQKQKIIDTDNETNH
jgi:hypothetical protein